MQKFHIFVTLIVLLLGLGFLSAVSVEAYPNESKSNAALFPTGSIAGTVTMFDGQPPERGEVEIFRHNGTGWQLERTTFLDEQTGEYQMENLRSGPYRLYAYAYYQEVAYSEYYSDASLFYDAITVTLSADTTAEINLTLDERGGQITGTVTSSTGLPLPNIEVTAYISDGPSWWNSRSTSTDSDGQYQFVALDPAFYQIGFRDGDGTYAFVNNATPISVTEGVIITDIDAELSLAGHTTGMVTMSDGQPPDSGGVHLYRANGTDWEWLTGSILDLQTGEYHVGGLPSGSYRLLADGNYQGNDYGQYYEDDIIITTGLTTSNIDVELIKQEGGRITGTVTMPNGQPPDWGGLSLYRANGTDWEWVGGPTLDLQTGQYDLGGLQGGSYRLLAYGNYQGHDYWEYYGNVPDLDSGLDISITAGSTTPDINIELNLPSRFSIYLPAISR